MAQLKPPRGRPPKDPVKLAQYHAQKAAWEAANGGAVVVQKKYQSNGPSSVAVVVPEVHVKTPEEMVKETDARFDTLKTLAQGAATGNSRAVIVSGAGGIGKTYTIEEIVKEAADEYGIRFTTVSGIVTPVMLFKLLWDNKTENDVIVLDDSDGVFSDEQALTILKAALDSKPVRKVSWLAASKVLAAEDIPNTFEYSGSIIFITNLPLAAMSKGNGKNAHHLYALITRASYLDLKLYTVDQVVAWIRHVVEKNDILVHSHKITKAQQTEILDWLTKNVKNLRDVSIRAAEQIAGFMKTNPTKWKQMAIHTFWA